MKLLEYRQDKGGLGLSLPESLKHLIIKNQTSEYSNLVGKCIILLNGQKDELVPPHLNNEFIKFARQYASEFEEYVDLDSDHKLSPLMKEKLNEWFQKHF